MTEKALTLKEKLGADRILALADWGGLPRAVVEESIARYAQEVAPALRA